MLLKKYKFFAGFSFLNRDSVNGYAKIVGRWGEKKTIETNVGKY